MDDSFFGIPIATDAKNAISVDRISLRATPSELVQFDQLCRDNQNYNSVDCGGYSSFTREQLDLCTEFHSRNQTMAMNSDALLTAPGRITMKEHIPSSSNVAASSEFHEHSFGAMPLSASALATLLASRSDLQENLNSLTLSAASSYPLEALRAYLPSDCSNSLKSSFNCATGHGCDEVFGNNPAHVDIGAARPVRAGFPPCSASRNVEDSGWFSSNGNAGTDDHYNFESRRITNELSLSLGTSQHTIMTGAIIPDQCSEIDCPTASQHSGIEMRLRSEQTSCDTTELELRASLHGHDQVSQDVAGSRFLEAIQEILSQIASYSLENLDQRSHFACGMKSGPNGFFASGYHVEGGPMIGSNEPTNVEGLNVEVDPALQRRALEAKKRQLLTLLEVVDERYNQCLDEIHTVVSAFHAAAELDPQLHARFALQSITLLYRGLRERISNQILAIGAHSESSSSREIQGSSETSYLQKQWTLHQLKKKDHQLWRPQRGLPDRSVSVLRAWMFQNFLHPYPKDSEKHLLAIKSGLTRSQVSNWFINARVRLWKPMIEEMYAEMNKRKSLKKGEGTNSSQATRITFNNRQFNMNQN